MNQLVQDNFSTSILSQIKTHLLPILFLGLNSLHSVSHGKFLPSPGLQGHQAELVVPTNKNKTCKIKMLTSFKCYNSSTMAKCWSSSPQH